MLSFTSTPLRLRMPRLALTLAALALAVAGPLAVAQEASAKREGKTVANEAKWIGFDAATNTVQVKIMKNGRGNKGLVKQFKKEVKKGKDVSFNVIPTGSVLTRTTVAINGVKGELTDIKPDKRIVVYWLEDPKKPGELFARKIDVVLSEEEFSKRYETVE